MRNGKWLKEIPPESNLSNFALLHFISIYPERQMVHMLCCGFQDVLGCSFASQTQKMSDFLKIKYLIYAVFQIHFTLTQ